METDCEHTMTVEKVAKAIHQYGISAERKEAVELTQVVDVVKSSKFYHRKKIKRID